MNTITLAAAKIPALRPPLDLIQPTFGERYWWIVPIVVLIWVSSAAWLIWRLRRPKPIVIASPESIARPALAALNGRAENGVLAGEVSRILRHYLLSIFHFPARAMSPEELAKALQLCPGMEPPLVKGLCDFLRQCDEWQFSPEPSTIGPGLITRAEQLVSEVESFQKRLQPAAPAEAVPTPVPTATVT